MISKKQAIKREFEIASATKKLIEEIQEARDRFNRDEVKHTKEILKIVRKGRTTQLINNLEECLRYDIKKAKTSFMPNHVKLRKEDGNIARSNERPEVLADHCGNKQWGIDEERVREKKYTIFFDYESDINCGHTDIEELFVILKKSQKR